MCNTLVWRATDFRYKLVLLRQVWRFKALGERLAGIGIGIGSVYSFIQGLSSKDNAALKGHTQRMPEGIMYIVCIVQCEFRLHDVVFYQGDLSICRLVGSFIRAARLPVDLDGLVSQLDCVVVASFCGFVDPEF